MLNQNSKLNKNKQDIIILSLAIIIFVIMMSLNIISGGKGVISIIYNYVAYPTLLFLVIYVSLHSYYINLTEKGKSSGRLAFLTYFAYVGMMFILYVIIIVAVFPYFLNVIRGFIGHILPSTSLVSLYVLFVISYGISFLLIFAISAAAELIIYAVIGRVNAPFITRGSNYLTIWLFRHPNYGGMAFGGVYKGFIIMRSMSDDVDEVSRGILVHEAQHLHGKHVPIVLSSVFAVPVYLQLMPSNVFPLFTYIILPFMILMPLVLFRVCEVNADRAMFKVYGSNALNYISAALRSTYGVSSVEKAPWSSKSLHTGRRDLVLMYGDAIAPHAVWEFPLLFSLLTASIMTIVYVSRAIPLINSMNLITYFTLLTYTGSILGSMVLTMLLGLILRPIARLLLGHILTERGFVEYFNAHCWALLSRDGGVYLLRY